MLLSCWTQLFYSTLGNQRTSQGWVNPKFVSLRPLQIVDTESMSTQRVMKARRVIP